MALSGSRCEASSLLQPWMGHGQSEEALTSRPGLGQLPAEPRTLSGHSAAFRNPICIFPPSPHLPLAPLTVWGAASWWAVVWGREVEVAGWASQVEDRAAGPGEGVEGGGQGCAELLRVMSCVVLCDDLLKAGAGGGQGSTLPPFPGSQGDLPTALWPPGAYVHREACGHKAIFKWGHLSVSGSPPGMRGQHLGPWD